MPILSSFKVASKTSSRTSRANKASRKPGWRFCSSAKTINQFPISLYRVWLPDGAARDRHLNDNGVARIDNIDPGACVVTFPTLDTDAWEA
jgi:hypothetical protein